MYLKFSKWFKEVPYFFETGPAPKTGVSSVPTESKLCTKNKIKHKVDYGETHVHKNACNVEYK